MVASDPLQAFHIWSCGPKLALGIFEDSLNQWVHKALLREIEATKGPVLRQFDQAVGGGTLDRCLLVHKTAPPIQRHFHTVLD
jgi:hypothetical protein